MRDLAPPSPSSLKQEIIEESLATVLAQPSDNPLDGLSTAALAYLQEPVTPVVEQSDISLSQTSQALTMEESSSQPKAKATGKRKREASPPSGMRPVADNNSQNGPRTRRRTENHSLSVRPPVYDLTDGGRPILSCDYCPLHWHMDCLDPPMTAIPARERKWMCPNHIEHIFVSRFVYPFVVSESLDRPSNQEFQSIRLPTWSTFWRSDIATLGCSTSFLMTHHRRRPHHASASIPSKWARSKTCGWARNGIAFLRPWYL